MRKTQRDKYDKIMTQVFSNDIISNREQKMGLEFDLISEEQKEFVEQYYIKLKREQNKMDESLILYTQIPMAYAVRENLCFLELLFHPECITTRKYFEEQVEDNIKPTFTAPASVEIFTDADCAYDVTVANTGDVTNEDDNCSTGINATFVDSDPVAGACEGTFVITRTWSLVDNCGNAADDQTQTITISDNIKPTFTAPARV